MVLPEGLLANDRWRFVREWLLPRVTLHAVVGLPRTTFRAGRITARTCLLIARKAPPGPDHEVLLAEVEHIGHRAGEPNDLPGVLEAWQDGREVVEEGKPWRVGR